RTGVARRAPLATRGVRRDTDRDHRPDGIARLAGRAVFDRGHPGIYTSSPRPGCSLAALSARLLRDARQGLGAIRRGAAPRERATARLGGAGREWLSVRS